MLKKFLFTVAVFASLWAGGLVYFFTKIPNESPIHIAEAEAIVVLTGGQNRIEAGVELLEMNKAPKMFVTGVGKDVKDLDLIKRLHLPEELRAKISLGRQATDTFGNLDEAKRWLEKNQIKSIILITANYHMPRALSLFRAGIPELKILPYAVIVKDFRKNKWFEHKPTSSMILSEYNKYVLSL